MKFFRKYLVITIAIAVLASFLSSFSALAASSRYFLTADDVTTAGLTQVSNIRSYLTSLGYTNSYSYLPTAVNIYVSDK